MKRTAFKRRSKPMPARNSKRHRRRKAEQDGAQAALVRCLPCAVCFRPRRYDEEFLRNVRVGRQGGWWLTEKSEAHHCPTKGAGGKDKDTMPLCTKHHRHFHNMGEKSFSERYGIDCREVAAMIAAELEGAQ